MTSLDYLLMGLLLRRAQSGYALGKTIQGLPAGSFSGSPGAVYPALQRLEQKGLIRSRATRAGNRRGTEYALSAKGRRGFEAWVRQPVTPKELLAAVDLVLVRFSFLQAVETPGGWGGQVRALQKQVADLRRDLRTFRRASAGDVASGPAAALDLLDELLEAYARWARKMLRR